MAAENGATDPAGLAAAQQSSAATESKGKGKAAAEQPVDDTSMAEDDDDDDDDEVDPEEVSTLARSHVVANSNLLLTMFAQEPEAGMQSLCNTQFTM